MPNISQIQRDELLSFIESLKKNHTTPEAIENFNSIEDILNQKHYGLIWEAHSEEVFDSLHHQVPIFIEDTAKKLSPIADTGYNFILEGDNLHSLHLLEKTHNNKIDVIYIDPPYNRGNNDFIYDDDFVDKKDGFKHSKWLSFMNHRLSKACNLLSDTGIIIINIDENEKANLHPLLNQIFGQKNALGEMIWNKKNPKGDAKGISYMHETIFVFAKNKEQFLALGNTCRRKKANAKEMLTKANMLFKKLGKKQLPTDVADAIKPFNYPKTLIKDFYVTYTLELINKEFKNWLTKQDFSNGEKAYKYIDENGRVYRGVSMAWPNKKQAPDDYFIPLIHPITKKPCPIPKRGWRNPPNTMSKLMSQGLILFGSDEKKQPEKKYYLDENMYENTPSVYENADSADDMLAKMGVKFEYAKPLSEAIYVLTSIHPNPKIILDFFAGSGTTGHAVMAMNKADNGDRQYILCSNNENNICEEATYKRMLHLQTEIPHNLKYLKTDFVPKSNNNTNGKFSLVNSDGSVNNSNSVNVSIKELVELEYHLEIDNKKYFLIENRQDVLQARKMREDIETKATLFVVHDLHLSNDEKNLLSKQKIELIQTPTYYLPNEL